ncbi:retrovirus-related pol polyprotein from transposon TNT 1-94 [Tanacetum coccineum]
MTPRKTHFESEKEAIHLILTGIGDEIYSTVDACQTAPRNVGSHQKATTSAPHLKLHFNQIFMQTTRYKGKEIAKPITPPSESAYEEDSNDNQTGQLGSEGSECCWGRETLGGPSIKCVQLQAEQSDWLADTDGRDLNEQELEAHYSYMAKIQEVPNTDSGTNSEPLFLKDVNARTKKPNVVPISTRKPKSQANKSVATPHKKTVASESTITNSKSYYRMLYKKTSKAWKWWIAQQCPSAYTWVPKTKRKWVPKVRNESVTKKIVQLILFIVDSGCTKHMTGNLSLLCNFVEKYLGTVRFGNDQFAPILGYGDLVQGNIMIKRVYYVEGLNHNLFSVGQFCDADLEVAFRKSTCFVRDLQGNDLLTGNRGTDLYTISLQETTSSTPICLMAKASPTQAWLWHQKLSHLNFDYINLLSKKYVVIGLPKLKYVKDQLCSSCEVSKAKRTSFKSKTVPSLKGRLNLLHMDLCGPMRVASINGKKFILVIVDDYSRYTWTLFLRSKDETPEVLKDFLTMIQRNLQAPNGVVERRNCTLVEAAQMMLSASQLPLFFWAEAIATACYTQNRSIIIPTHEKMAYHIISDRKPLIKHLHIFGCTCYLTRDGENLDKIKEKGDPCILVGYSTQSKGYRVYNKRTRLIVESIYLRFDEIKEMSETSVANDTSGLVPQRQKASDYENPDPAPELQTVSPLVDTTSSYPTDNSAPQDTHPSTNIHPTSEPSTPTNVHAEENNNDQTEFTNLFVNQYKKMLSHPHVILVSFFKLLCTTDDAWTAVRDLVHYAALKYPNHPDKVYQSEKASIWIETSSESHDIKQWNDEITLKELKDLSILKRYLSHGLWYPKGSGFEHNSFFQTAGSAVACDTRKKAFGGNLSFLGDSSQLDVQDAKTVMQCHPAKDEYVALSASYAQRKGFSISSEALVLMFDSAEPGVHKLLTRVLRIIIVIMPELQSVSSLVFTNDGMEILPGRSYALSWKPCQGDSLNLPDHRIHKDGDGDASFQLKSDSLPHAHAQTTKTFYKHQDSRIMKAQELKTKTSAQTLIYKIFLQRYQVYQGRLLASFQDDAKYEHVGQDTRSQGGKDDQDK